MPKKNKTLCVDDLRHVEYYGMQPVFDELYHRSLEGENFTDLMDLILSRDNILLAYRNIKANGGSYTAGTDNRNISDIGCLPPETVVEKVRFIVTGSHHGYRPKPVRRKDIPKPNGKTRPLGIPCIWDRLVQQCIKQVIAYIKNKIPMAKKTAVCSYTADGRALIHTNLSLNSFVLAGLRNQPSMGRSTELTDSRISLFSAQRGKCALSGELFENAADIVCWLKTPAEFGGRERYQNMILFHRRFLPLLQRRPMNELKAIADTLKTTKELKLKVNSLRERAGLSAIE